MKVIRIGDVRILTMSSAAEATSLQWGRRLTEILGVTLVLCTLSDVILHPIAT